MTMNLFNLNQLAEEAGGKYVPGLEGLDTHAAYLVHGFLEPKESGRKILPGRELEQILSQNHGKVTTPDEMFSPGPGEAIHIREDDTFYLANIGTGTAYCVLAGGHPPHRK